MLSPSHLLVQRAASKSSHPDRILAIPSHSKNKSSWRIRSSNLAIKRIALRAIPHHSDVLVALGLNIINPTCPDSLVASQNDEEFLPDHTPTTPVTATRRRLASISDGSRKPYINLHKVCMLISKDLLVHACMDKFKTAKWFHPFLLHT